MFAARKIQSALFAKSCFLSLLLAAMVVRGQGTFVYDQQSADESSALEGSVGLGQQPLGQSFTPALSSVGFFRLYIYDGVPGGGGIISINLRTNSIGGTILGSTMPVILASQYSGFTDFFFSTPVGLAAGSTYYFQPVVQSGGGFGTLVGNYHYSGGNAVISGTADSSRDLWFREGIVAPEPSSLFLLIGSGVLLYVRHKKNQKCSVR